MDECDRRRAEQVDGWQLLRPQLRASTKRAYRFHLPGALIAMVLLARAAFCSCLRRKLFLFVISCEASLGRASRALRGRRVRGLRRRSGVESARTGLCATFSVHGEAPWAVV
jgi:hypothetical protein